MGRLEQRNREIWEGHSHVFEDLTHTIGGVGLGLLLYPAVRGQSKAMGYTLLLLSTALHFYADMTEKPRRTRVLSRAAEAIGVS